MAKLIRKGGSGSGNWGHAGRPGKVGGSAKNGSAAPQGELFDRESYYVPPTHFDKLAAKTEDGIEWSFGTPSPPDGETVDSILAKQDDWVDEKMLEMVSDPNDYDLAEKKFDDKIISELAEETGLSEETINGFFREWRVSSNNGVNDLFVQNEAARLFSDTFGTQLSGWQNSKVMYEAIYGNLRKFDGKGNGEQIYDNADDAADGLAEKQSMFIHEDGVVGVTDAKLKTDELLRGIYNKTQDELTAAGIDGLYLFRGVKRDDAQTIFLGEDLMADNNNALESWSSSPEQARRFAADVSPYYPEDYGLPSYEEDSGYEPTMKEKFLVNTDGLILASYIPKERIFSTPFTGFGMLAEKEFVVLNTEGTDTNDDVSEAVAVYTTDGGIEEDEKVLDSSEWDIVYDETVH